MVTMPAGVGGHLQASQDFDTHYCNLCALQDTAPSAEVRAHLQQGVLDINSDRIKLADWPPILNTLRINKSLRFVAVRSFFVPSLDKEGNSKKRHYFKRRSPIIRSKDLTLRLAQAIAGCLKDNKNLKCLDLQGIPFRNRDLDIIAKGLASNHSVTHVSMEYCQIEDKGCEKILKSLKHHPSLTHLNFTACSLTWKSAELVSKIIKFQSAERHSEAWVESLRYRQANVESMTGLRRITLNCNPLIGDEGAQALAEALKDDLWLKALDLQKCGISGDGAHNLLETLNQNKTLIVLDVRFNPLIDSNILQTLIGQVLTNSNGDSEDEFPWIIAKLPKDPYHTRPRRSHKQIGSVYRMKTSIRAGSRQTLRNSARSSTSATVEDGGVPWRTAYRASQYKMLDNHKHMVGTPRYLQNAQAGQVTIEVEEEDEVSVCSPTRCIDAEPKATPLPSRNPVTVAIKSYDAKIRQLEAELLGAHKTIAEEEKARHLVEQHAMNLEVENVRLKRDLENEREVNCMRSSLDDELLLERVENSFRKFHDFLDLLKRLGLGGLVAYAGMTDLQYPLGDTKNEEKTESGLQGGDGKLNGSNAGRRPVKKPKHLKKGPATDTPVHITEHSRNGQEIQMDWGEMHHEEQESGAGDAQMPGSLCYSGGWKELDGGTASTGRVSRKEPESSYKEQFGNCNG